jgi:hypothetical protein
VTISAGAILTVRLGEPLSTERNLPGDSFRATLDQPILIDGLVIAERGARVTGRVVESGKAGRVKGLSHLKLEVTRLMTSDGQWVNVRTGGAAGTGAVLTTRGKPVDLPAETRLSFRLSEAVTITEKLK